MADAIGFAFQQSLPAIARIYVALSVSLSRIPGVLVASGSHGFISQELRGYRGGDWCYSLVLNKQWIRLYIRNPELARGMILPKIFLSDFPDAEITAKGEIALNIAHEESARDLCAWFERISP